MPANVSVARLCVFWYLCILCKADSDSELLFSAAQMTHVQIKTQAETMLEKRR